MRVKKPDFDLLVSNFKSLVAGVSCLFISLIWEGQAGLLNF